MEDTAGTGHHYLCCQVCTQDYTSPPGAQVPLFLPCGHSFCSACIARIKVVEGKKKCPACRAVFSIHTHLQTNFAVLQINAGTGKREKPLSQCSADELTRLAEHKRLELAELQEMAAQRRTAEEALQQLQKEEVAAAEMFSACQAQDEVACAEASLKAIRQRILDVGMTPLPIATVAMVERVGSVNALLALMVGHAWVGGGLAAGAVLKKVADLASQSAANTARLGAEGVCERVVAALKAHTLQVEVAEQGCVAIAALCLDLDTWVGPGWAINTDNAAKLTAQGACGTVLTVMRAHAKEAGNTAVMTAACGAVGNLALHANNQATLIGEGAAELVLSAMRAHPGDVSALAGVCGAVCNLASDSMGKARLGEGGACLLVLEAVQAHSDSAEIATWGCKALARLATESPSNQALLRASEAVEVCQAVLRKHPQAGTFATEVLEQLYRVVQPRAAAAKSGSCGCTRVF